MYALLINEITWFKHIKIKDLYNILKLRIGIFIIPNLIVMPTTTTSIEVKCECNIPFHSELTDYLQLLSSDSISNQQEVPHKEAIRDALKNKLLFIKIHLTCPIKKIRSKLIAVARSGLNKELVGTIRVGKNEITLILL